MEIPTGRKARLVFLKRKKTSMMFLSRRKRGVLSLALVMLSEHGDAPEFSAETKPDNKFVRKSRLMP
jgi:hypothetical protein